MKIYNIVWRNCKWRFQNPSTILMNIVQPVIWLLLFSTLFNPIQNEGNYTAFIFPALLIMSVIMSAGIGCGMGNYALKSSGSFYRLYIAPIKRRSIILGQILDVEILAFIGIAVLFILSAPFSIRISSGFTGFLIMITVLFVCIFFMASFSYVISSILPDENSFIGLMNTITLPLFFVSSALMPVHQLPKFFQVASKINPFTYAINILRDLFSTPAIEWSNILITLTLFSGLSLLCFILAVKRLESLQLK